MAKKRKKPRSAKQKAASKRNIKKARAARRRPKRKASKRKASKRKSGKRKVNKAKKKSKSVVKRGVLSKVTNNPTLKKVLMAAGAVTIASSVAALVAPQFVPTLQKPIVRAALGFVAGDFIGAASNFVLGGGGSGLLGGSGSRPVTMNTGSGGFA